MIVLYRPFEGSKFYSASYFLGLFYRLFLLDTRFCLFFALHWRLRITSIALRGRRWCLVCYVALSTICLRRLVYEIGVWLNVYELRECFDYIDGNDLVNNQREKYYWYVLHCMLKVVADHYNIVAIYRRKSRFVAFYNFAAIAKDNVR